MKSLAVADKHGYPRYVANQTYYSLIGRDYEWELMPLGLDQGLGAVVWSPLGWGRLTGKIRRGTAAAGDEPPARDRRVRSAGRGRVSVQASSMRSTRWRRKPARPFRRSRSTGCCSGRPCRRSIIGARNEQQLKHNLGAIGWSLQPEQMAQLDAASATTLAYPYWHQRGFAERNPPPV